MKGGEDLLILVDEADLEIGTLAKTAGHLGAGTLHRAFSDFVFNPAGEVLIQQRAPLKMLWPGYWSNSCCSHPRPGETAEIAVQRRLGEELGLACRLSFLFKFIYQARFGTVGSEHELCHVYAGHTRGTPVADPTEISQYRWVTPQQLTQDIETHPECFSPWMKQEWLRIDADFLTTITADLGR